MSTLGWNVSSSCDGIILPSANAGHMKLFRCEVSNIRRKKCKTGFYDWIVLDLFMHQHKQVATVFTDVIIVNRY
jgi:hypothetical protein